MDEEEQQIQPVPEEAQLLSNSQNDNERSPCERLVISNIENINFKSYAGKQVLGPFHKVCSTPLFFPFFTLILFCFSLYFAFLFVCCILCIIFFIFFQVFFCILEFTLDHIVASKKGIYLSQEMR